jgi:hypothetical protein
MAAPHEIPDSLHTRENDELEQAELAQRSHLGQHRVVLDYQFLVIEGLLQPAPHRLKTAGIHDPTTSVEAVGFELQMHCERVAVKEPAVGG